MRATRLLMVLSVASGVAQAQKAPACKVDTTAAWYAKQRAWFDDSRHNWSNDTLRTSLLRAAKVVSNADLTMQYGWVMTKTFVLDDSAMVSYLRGLATTRGSTWPTRSVVGGAGTRAVWIVATRDTGLARATLKRMMEAGPDESNAADVAVLDDRMRLLSGRKQIYGTHFQVDNGKVEPLPTEDLAHIDMRREDAGLPPFALSRCLAAART